jgi:hypothetical protein
VNWSATVKEHVAESLRFHVNWSATVKVHAAESLRFHVNWSASVKEHVAESLRLKTTHRTKGSWDPLPMYKTHHSNGPRFVIKMCTVVNTLILNS